MTDLRDPRMVQALADETEAARHLLGHTLGLLAGFRFVDTHLHAVFACWALGAEKLTKVTLGLVALDTHGAGPRRP